MGVGALIVLGTESLLGALGASFGLSLTSFPVFLLGITIAFVSGGAIIGWMSPGWTTWEAGYASAIAACGTVALVMRLLDFGPGLFSTIPFALLWGLLCGVGGGWLGERLQGPR